jgi:hypothetical protein
VFGRTYIGFVWYIYSEKILHIDLCCEKNIMEGIEIKETEPAREAREARSNPQQEREMQKSLHACSTAVRPEGRGMLLTRHDAVLILRSVANPA